MDDKRLQDKLHYAGEKVPSMKRRHSEHDYHGRCFYLVTLAVEGRQPVLGRLVGRSTAPAASVEAPHVELSPLGRVVDRIWRDVSRYYPQVAVVATMVMPDHLHGILFVRESIAFHLGQVVKGFKVGCNKALRVLVEDGTLPQYAAILSQPTGMGEGRTGLLWEQGYNDRILFNYGTLETWKAYLRDNPLRLAIRREHPDYFRVCFDVIVGSQRYAAIGNRFLLSYPAKEAVQCSRSLMAEQVEKLREVYLAKARSGTVLVSPAISKGEQAVMRAALDAGEKLVFVTPWGFNRFSKPGHQYYEACAAGRLLLLAPWPHQNERIPLTRVMCLALNAMAREVAASLPGKLR